MKKYIICDTTNNIIASFNSWKEAELFKWIRGGTNWSIKVVETTKLYNCQYIIFQYVNIEILYTFYRAV